MLELQINKKDITQSQVVEIQKPTLNEGEVLVKIDRYGFTANNISYAALGDMIRYWEFFPANNSDNQNWGVIPVWGFADVVESKSNDLPVGDRLFGYFPPASVLKMSPTQISNQRFIEGSEHRSTLPAGYNIYHRVLAEAGYNRDNDTERMLLYPLYITSFCLHDMLQDKNWLDAKQIIIISASSKTSIGLAYALESDSNSPEIIGLTSERNSTLVESLNLYDKTITYNNLTYIDNSKPSVILDLSGDLDVVGKLHKHLGDNMNFTFNVGLTHWDDRQPSENIIQERSEMFFAPGHIQKRVKEWGNEKFEEKSNQFMIETAAKSRSWLKIKNISSVKGLADIYPDICAGKIAPDSALAIVM